MTIPRALVVEDDPAHRALLILMLERQGFAVVGAANGDEALAMIDTTSPDVLLADLSLPRRDGLSLTRAARERRPGLPVMILTGHSTSDVRVRALREMEGVAVVAKPPQFGSLGDRLRDLIAAAGAEVVPGAVLLGA